MLDSKTNSKKPLLGERYTSTPAHFGHRRLSTKSVILPIKSPIRSSAPRTSSTPSELISNVHTTHAMLPSQSQP